MQSELSSVPTNSIKMDPRFRQDYGDLKELTASIVKYGQIQTIAVERRPDDHLWLIAGGRRLAAHAAAKLETVDVKIYPELTPQERRWIELEENVQRKDLEWAEEVALKQEIHTLGIAIHGEKVGTDSTAAGWTKQKTAELFGESPGNTSTDLKLAEAMEILPELKNCKTKTEAKRVMGRFQQMLESKVAVESVRESLATDGATAAHKRLLTWYHHGDCTEGMKGMPTGVAGLAEIDPPYAIDLNTIRKGETMKATTYNECPPDEYETLMRAVLTEAYRILKPDSFCLVWHAIDKWQTPIREWSRDVGFDDRGIPAIWVKPAGQSQDPYRHLGSAYEAFLYLRKGNPRIQRPGQTNVFKYKPIAPSSKRHPTERPIEMMQRILEVFATPKSLVLVPFGGSFNTGLAAANLNMTAAAWDLSQEYIDGFGHAVSRAVPGQYVSYKSEQEEQEEEDIATLEV